MPKPSGIDAEAYALLRRLGELQKQVAQARKSGDHSRALTLLFEQEDALKNEASRSTGDAATVETILQKVRKTMEEVRAEMHAKPVDAAAASVSAEEPRGRKRVVDEAKEIDAPPKQPTAATTTKATTSNFAAVDAALANKTKHDWGQAPPPIMVDLEQDDDMDALDELNIDLYSEQRPAAAGGRGAKQKPFEPPAMNPNRKKARGDANRGKEDAGGPKSRWSADAERGETNKPPTRFMSAGERLDLEQAAKGLPPTHAQYRAAREANGATRTYGRGRNGTGFVPPYGGGGGGGNGQRVKPNQNANGEDDTQPFSEAVMQKLSPNGEPISEDILKIDREIVERVVSEILDRHERVDWDSIAGLEHPKAAVQELAVWPMMNPELFVGARAVPKGLLLFGPPGTGKTLIGRAVASQCGATFFSISASSLTSKWIGEGEKMVRALFAVARHLSPAVIFVDEIDSLLSARKSDGEHESSRRMKTEFLVQMDGLGGGENDRLLLIGATNRPQELDDGARRRLPKQLYIPLPCAAARRDMILRTLSAGKGVAHKLSESDLDTICEKTDGYSGSDMKHLIQEAARAPVRETFQKTKDIPGPVSPSSLRPIVLADIRRAAKQVRPSVTRADVEFHEEWNKHHGALTAGAGDDDDDDESW